MTREEAIQILSTRDAHGVLCGYTSGVTKALDMAIDALQFVKHFDLLKEYQSLQEVVLCKDCKHWTEEKDEEDDILYGWCRAPFENDNLLVYGDDATRIFTAYDFFCKSGKRRET